MALANVAEWFRLQGLKVVMVDWDLEAPGLETFFVADTAEREAARGKLGLIDQIVIYRELFPNLHQPTAAENLLSEQPKTRSDEFVKILYDALPPIRHLLVPTKSSTPLKAGGSLALLPAGCRSESRFDAYAETVQRFDWADFYANFQGEAYFEWLRRQLNDPSVADIVLIDSRTGVAEMSGVCTRQLADVVVILCGPNDQNLDGVVMMVRSFIRGDVMEARGGRPIDLIIVPARIDVTEGRPNDLFEAQFRAKLDGYMPPAFKLIGTDYQRLRIPYVSAYSYAERLAVGDPEGAKVLQDAYGLLAVHIAVLAPMESAVKLRCIEPITKAFGRIEQLDRALDAGLIDQATYETAVAAVNAQLSGSGTIAQAPVRFAVSRGAAVVGGTQGVINTGLIIQQGTKSGASREDLRRAYLARILAQANQLPLLVGDSPMVQISLSSLYTPMLTTRGDDGAASHNLAHDIGATPEREAKSLSAIDVLNAERKLVLLGGPGSGKSTFVNFVALCMAGEILGAAAINLQTLTAPIPSEPHNHKESQPQRWDHGALLPVPVVLRDFASELPAAGTAVNASTMWQHIEGRLNRAAIDDFAPHLRDELQTRGGLILLDGLDEVFGSLTQRQQIKQAVQDFANTFAKCRFLVTSRPYAYTQQEWKLSGFAEVVLLPFMPGQVQRFVDAWYAQLSEMSQLSETDAKARADLLKRMIAGNNWLDGLAKQPIFLSLIVRLHTERGALAENREKLCAEVVDLLLHQWETLKVRFKPDGTQETEASLAEFLNAGQDNIRRELDRLAFEALLVGTTDIREEQLVMALLNAAPTKTDLKPKLLVEYLRDRVGLLIPCGEGQYRFPHRLFQEYLAACHLTVDEFPDKLSELARTDPSRWREPTLLAAAKVARATSESAWSLVEALCQEDNPPAQEEPPAADLWGALLAAQVLWEMGLAQSNPKTALRNEKKRQRVQTWMHAIIERGWLNPIERALAGDILGAMGDYRPGVNLTEEGLPDIAWVEIMGGKFRSGDGAHSRRVTVDRFYIARYAVTVAQFRAFVEDGGYGGQNFWTLEGWRWRTNASRENPAEWNSQLVYPNRPVVGVSWYEAIAFCRWLAQQTNQQTITLPTEEQWEYAARGIVGRCHPWGDSDWTEQLANCDSSKIGHPTTVGMYPAGATPEQVFDLAGNTREWLLSLHQDILVRPSEDRDDTEASGQRTARGGGWSSPKRALRGAYRERLEPASGDPDIGFRPIRLD